MKKTLILAAVFITGLGFAPHVLAAGFTALAPITGLTDTTGAVNSQDLANFFNNLYKYLVGLAGILAVIEIIWGGLEISTKDSVSKKSDGRERIIQALLGLVLVLSPYLVFYIINPSILNLSLNLPPINLAIPGVVDTKPPITGGCTPTPNSSPYLETAVCTNLTFATDYSCKQTMLQLYTPACTLIDANNICQQTPYKVYCTGKTLTLTYYQPYSTGGSRVLVGSLVVIPSDQAAETEFKNGCAGAGGVFTSELTASAKFLTLGGNIAPSLFTSCSGYQGITYDPTKYGGVVCLGQNLSCNAPS